MNLLTWSPLESLAGWQDAHSRGSASLALMSREGPSKAVYQCHVYVKRQFHDAIGKVPESPRTFILRFRSCISSFHGALDREPLTGIRD